MVNNNGNITRRGAIPRFPDLEIVALSMTAQPAAPAAIYTIDGKRVNSMQKGGIYIIGGKKVVM